MLKKWLEIVVKWSKKRRTLYFCQNKAFNFWLSSYYSLSPTWKLDNPYFSSNPKNFKGEGIPYVHAKIWREGMIPPSAPPFPSALICHILHVNTFKERAELAKLETFCTSWHLTWLLYPMFLGLNLMQIQFYFIGWT